MNHIVRRLTGLSMCRPSPPSMLPAASLAAAPALTDLAADRQSDTTGLVSFTSDVEGEATPTRYWRPEERPRANGETGSGSLLAGANTLRHWRG